MRALMSARFSVTSTNVTLAASSAGSVDHFWMKTRTARSSALDLAGRLGDQRLGVRQDHGDAERRLAVDDLLQEASRAARRTPPARAAALARSSVPCTLSITATASVKCLCDFAGVEDRAVGALVLDHDVALAEDPVGEEPA